MRVRTTTLSAAVYAVAIATAANVLAQTGGANSQVKLFGHPPLQTEGGGVGVNPDGTLEIAPRNAPSPPKEPSASLAPGDSGGLIESPEPGIPAVPTSGPPASMVSNIPRTALPYLGISVQRIETHSTPGRSIEGLEVVGVDPDSPAALAGLKGRSGMTTLGASGATAGALMAPLDIALMPLLNKTGQLGRTGDLIVAIDDRRVDSELDLETALGDAKPGDTIYLTIVRYGNAGTHHLTKIPVKLGKQAVAR